MFILSLFASHSKSERTNLIYNLAFHPHPHPHTHPYIHTHIHTPQTHTHTLEALPTILNKRRSFLTVVLGNQLLFQLQAEGLPSLSFQWSKNGNRLVDPASNGSNGSNVFEGPRLLIERVEEGDAGEYSCRVSTVAGSVLWETLTVEVVSQPGSSSGGGEGVMLRLHRLLHLHLLSS